MRCPAERPHRYDLTSPRTTEQRTAHHVTTHDAHTPQSPDGRPTPIDDPSDDPSDGMAGTSRPSRSERVGFLLAQILVILPVWIAAYRDGHEGWYPAMDAATTVLRARDVLGGNFPLIGMWTSVSEKLGTATYFPGATELYVLSVPNRILGYAWGTLVGIALLNSFWLVCAGWLLRRRLGDRGAIWGLVAFALLVWTMGSETLVDVSPMQMITIPFAVFCVAVWSVADHDVGAIPILALIANFLVLNHLVLTMLVPVIGLCAVVWLISGARSLRRDDPATWAAERRQLIRNGTIALVITVVLWIPTIIQQLTNSPGNLTNLYNASRIDLSRTVTMSGALDVVVALLARPPFWFRPTFSATSEASPIGPLGITIGVFLVVLVVALAVAAVRRSDRLALTALVVATVAALTSILNILNAPTDYGFRRQYFRSLWGMAMFFWLAVGLAASRTLPARLRPPRVLGALGLAAVLVVALAASPHRDPGTGTNGTTDNSVLLANKVMNHTLVLLRRKGQVEVSSAGDFSSFGLASTLILAAENYGIDVCVPSNMVAQYGRHRACRRDGPDTQVRVSSAAFAPYPGETVLTQATLLSHAEQQTKERLTPKVAAWLGTLDRIEPSPRVDRILTDAYGVAGSAMYTGGIFDTDGASLSTLVFSPPFVKFISKRSEWRADGTVDPAIKTGSFPAEDLVRWADLTWREYTGESVRISEVAPTSQASSHSSDN